MDLLDVMAKAAELGGTERKQAMKQTIIKARELGCETSPSSSKVGGVNVRYGTIGYAVMDINARGEVFLHIKHHPSKEIEPEDQVKANEYLMSLKGLEIKNAPVNHYGQCAEPIEDIDADVLGTFLEFAVKRIRTKFYDPHLEA